MAGFTWRTAEFTAQKSSFVHYVRTAKCEPLSYPSGTTQFQALLRPPPTNPRQKPMRRSSAFSPFVSSCAFLSVVGIVVIGGSVAQAAKSKEKAAKAGKTKAIEKSSFGK